MSTATLTKPRRRRKAPRPKATRTKRGRPAAADYPMPFSELPLRVQELAIEKWREVNWESSDDQDQVVVRIDGDITKDAELDVRESPAVQALVEAAQALLADACDRGEAMPDKNCLEEEDNPWPRDEDGDAWFADYFALREALKPFDPKLVPAPAAQTE